MPPPPSGRFGLRAEAAYTWTEDATGLDPFVKNPFFYGVAGADRTFLEYLNINLQYFVRQVSNYSDPNAIADPIARTVALQQAVICQPAGQDPARCEPARRATNG